jgi:NAD(P)-dependent dehydrogenase (short-subunit alcohol dehydrogenase family)
MDVSDSQSIRKAAMWLAEREPTLDVLINNAGIYPDGRHSILNISRDQLGETFQTNTFGPIEVTQTFLPLLRKSTAARVINVSSGYGQLDGLSAQVPSYCLSKLALNGVTLMMADMLKADSIAVNSIDPGWVRTRMGGSSATRSVSEGAAGIVWLASRAPHEWTGRFFRDGQPIEW